jgi:hypothetical protein
VRQWTVPASLEAVDGLEHLFTLRAYDAFDAIRLALFVNYDVRTRIGRLQCKVSYGDLRPVTLKHVSHCL